jgi:hypothetical protein
VVVVVPRAAAPVPVAAPAAGSSLASFYDDADAAAAESEEEDMTTPLYVEGANRDQMKRLKSNSALYRPGLINRVTPTAAGYKAHGVTMDTRAFWTNSLVENAFAARHYLYCGVATAINHEANSEGTFSFAGRAFNKFRTTMKSEQLCDTVVAAAGEKLKTTEPADVQHTFKRLRGEGVVAAFWGAEAAAAALAAAAAALAATAADPAAAGGD